jgi:hypothetical protein
MTVLASVAELRFMHLRVAGHAVRAGARRSNVALVVTVLALRFRMTAGEAQTWMIGPDVGDFSPIGFIVTRRALGSRKLALVRVLVTGNTIGLESEKGRCATPIAQVVAVFATRRTVGAL